MHQRRNFRVTLPRRRNLPRREPGMYRTMPLPQHHLGLPQLLRGVAAQPLEGIPDYHLFQGDAQLQGGIAPQVLVGQKQNPLRPLKSPAQHRRRVRGSANRAIVAPAQGFNPGNGVHISNRNNAAIPVQNFLQILPRVLHIPHRRHIGH